MRRALAAVFLAAQAADMLTTAVALTSGRFVEANPVFAVVFGHGLLIGLALKLGAVLAVLGGALWLYRRNRIAGIRALIIVAALSVLAPIANLAALL